MAKAIVEIIGAIWKIGPTKKVGRDQRWVRKFLVKELNATWPNVWGLEMWHEDNVNLLNYFKEAQVVTCKCVVIGRQYTNRDGQDDSYTTLQCIEIKLS